MTTSSRAAAREKRRPAPHNGGSSRLLNRMETPLPPASRALPMKQASVSRSRLPVIGQRYAGRSRFPTPPPSPSLVNDGSGGMGADAIERRNMRVGAGATAGTSSALLDQPFDHPDDPSVSVWTDGPSNVSRLDPSVAVQIDAEHPSRNRVHGRPPRRVAPRTTRRCSPLPASRPRVYPVLCRCDSEIKPARAARFEISRHCRSGRP